MSSVEFFHTKKEHPTLNVTIGPIFLFFYKYLFIFIVTFRYTPITVYLSCLLCTEVSVLFNYTRIQPPVLHCLLYQSSPTHLTCVSILPFSSSSFGLSKRITKINTWVVGEVPRVYRISVVSIGVRPELQ